MSDHWQLFLSCTPTLARPRYEGKNSLIYFSDRSFADAGNANCLSFNHPNNEDEQVYASQNYIANFTKGIIFWQAAASRR